MDALTYSPDCFDHFKIGPDGKPFAGDHVLADFYGIQYRPSLRRAKQIILQAIAASGATKIRIEITRTRGVLSVIGILAESHISLHIHSRARMAFIDAFMCGTADPFAAVQTIRESLRPKTDHVVHFRRGYRTLRPIPISESALF